MATKEGTKFRASHLGLRISISCWWSIGIIDAGRVTNELLCRYIRIFFDSEEVIE